MDLEEFKSSNASTDSEKKFQKESSYTLDVEVDGEIMAKAGSMIGHTGDLSFTGQSSAEGGITGFIKEATTSEGTPVMSIEGTGHAYLADGGKKVIILDLDRGEEITVNGDDILAFESSVSYEISTIDSLAGAAAGGLTNVYLSGPGNVALTVYGDPLVLTPPVSTDPDATVAWSGPSPSVEINSSLSDMVGQESGERAQMEFAGGSGFVVVQPLEEGGSTQQQA
jgi:uncharacterized protein (AIM24 family)